jgi:hypothetical protein
VKESATLTNPINALELEKTHTIRISLRGRLFFLALKSHSKWLKSEEELGFGSPVLTLKFNKVSRATG